MKAVILVGGEGTRLRPLTLMTPKPVVPVVDRPFLRHQLDLLAGVGVREVVFSVAYQPDKIQAVFGDGSALGIRIHYAVEATPLGTGGAVKDILDAAIKGADGVFHFAALWLLQGHEFPRAAFDVNVRGTFNVLEACVANKLQRLVYSSSASVYGDAVEEPMTEDHPFLNKNFYGATKIAGEAMLRAFHNRYGLNYVGLRYMNVYGPRQDYHGAYIAVIMKMLDAIDRGDSPTIMGDGSEAFDFGAVEDCGLANVCAMKADSVDAFYNVGTGKRTSLKELALHRRRHPHRRRQGAARDAAHHAPDSLLAHVLSRVTAAVPSLPKDRVEDVIVGCAIP